MRFNAKELTCLACQSSDQYDKEGVLIVKERQEGLFRKGEGCICYSISCCYESRYVRNQLVGSLMCVLHYVTTVMLYNHVTSVVI